MADEGWTSERLVRAVADGDPDAFTLLYRRHLDLVLAFLRARVAEPEVAFDVAAETFAAVIGSAGRFRDDGPPAEAWLLGIARHKLLESLRRGRVEERARRRLGLTAIALDDDDLAAVDDRSAAGAARLRSLLDELSPSTREAVVARIVLDESYSTVAARLECSEQVARQRVSRGLRTLRAGLEDAP